MNARIQVQQSTRNDVIDSNSRFQIQSNSYSSLLSQCPILREIIWKMEKPYLDEKQIRKSDVELTSCAMCILHWALALLSFQTFSAESSVYLKNCGSDEFYNYCVSVSVSNCSLRSCFEILSPFSTFQKPCTHRN